LTSPIDTVEDEDPKAKKDPKKAPTTPLEEGEEGNATKI
jgi:hypothetical protein